MPTSETRGHNLSLPRHRYVYVRPEFVLADAPEPPVGVKVMDRLLDAALRRPTGEGTAMIPGLWFGVSVQPGRMLHCHVLLENGALVADLPLHALRWDRDTVVEAGPEVCAWDCYGWMAEAWEPEPMGGLDAEVLDAQHQSTQTEGNLWFAIDHLGDGYSLEPEQHKLFWIVAHEHGHLLCLPQDRLLVTEKSFTKVAGVPPIKRQRRFWSAE